MHTDANALDSVATCGCLITHMSRKLINEPEDVVSESLEGLALAFPDLLRIHYAPHFVCRADAPIRNKVVLVSGSGSGHEPLNTGYVGRGMLDAACPGGIFTSPTPDQYLAALNAVYGGAGAIFFIKNFAGGVLNMSMALDMARDEGYEVMSVLINDDVAMDDPEKRRGLGATVLAEKLAGAAAEQGRSLAEVTVIAQQVIAESRSMGAALSSCTVPTIGRPIYQLPNGQMELGVGMHGERGRQRLAYTDADQLTDLLAAPVVEDLDLNAGDEVLAVVSGLGGTPQQELYIVFRRLYRFLEARGIKVTRRLVGNYITSLDAAGCAITLLRLTPELTALWDAPVCTPTLRW